MRLLQGQLKSSIMLFGAAVWLSGATAAGAQQPDAVASMVETALEEFETSNGPIVEVEGRLVCADRRPDERETCPEPRADVVIGEYAERLEAGLVFDEPPLPACRWNEVEVRGRAGVRMSVRLSGDPEEVIWISVIVQCREDPDQFGREFVQALRYPFKMIDGEWQRSGEAVTVIS